ncbi:MAG: C25 family cysteine peptidase [Acidobacteriota bacterium]
MKSIRIIALGILFAGALGIASLPAAQQQIVLTAPSYQITPGADGSHRIVMPGYASLGVPGYPDLPVRVFYVALPPDVEIGTISVASDETAPVSLGRFVIPEMPPLAAWDGKDRVLDPYQSVYGRDAYFPEKTVEYAGFSRLRKWRIAKIAYSPFRYNPVTKDLVFVPGATVRISYSLAAVRLASDAQLADGAMDDRARGLLLNYSSAAEWYRPAVVVPQAQATNDYVIITTNAIESAHAAALADFTAYLTGQGHTPLVITEDEFGGLTGQSPDGTAEKIRQWLIDNYAALAVKYVLLIGNPDPAAGDIPMKMCWPRSDQSSYQESPTDYFYADLTGNWDLDADGNFGEYAGDRGTGGVDFVNEVYVGRIPVYEEYPYLDDVLAKIIAYGSSSDTAWRRKALLPESFSDATTDGAYLGEAMVNNYVAPSGMGYHRLYMQGNFCAAANSVFDSEEELLSGATAAHWDANPYGLVLWWGHGNWFGAYLGYTDCGTGYILNANDVSSLDDSRPAFVYQCSCSNGTPEEPSNLGSLLLIRGAVATVAASRVSWYAVTSWRLSLKYYADNASIGYYYAEQLVTGAKPAGDALFAVKSDMGVNMYSAWTGASWMNLFDFNLFGDPASRLFSDLVVAGSIRDTNNSPIAGAAVNYGAGSVTTDASGFYSVRVAPGWSGTLTPSKSGYEFLPASRTYSGLAASSLNQDYARTNTTPGVTTAAVSGISTTTAASGGVVLADGGAAVTARGVCWSTAEHPTAAGSHTTDGSGTGAFTSSLTGLVPSTLYYVRAYATNSHGTAYGEELAFTTAQLVYTLSLAAGGAGGGAVKVGGTSHDLPYEEGFAAGSQAVIEAVPAAGSVFAGWSGDFNSADNPATVTMDGPKSVTANFGVVTIYPDDFVGTWDGQGVYYRNSDTGAWVALSSPATMIAAGDLDGDGIDDLIGLWPSQGGIWVKYSQSGAWAKLSSTAVHIAAGDMNGDGRADLLGTWDGQGVFYRSSVSGAWVKLASPATMITTGDIDGDGTDDLVGIWPSQGGVWVKYSQSGAWVRLSSTAADIAVADMNGDGRDDLLATWDGQGVYYRNSMNGAWVRMASQASQVAGGDIDADGTADLIGIWPSQGGVWVKYSNGSAWARLSSSARDIAAGTMRAQGTIAEAGGLAAAARTAPAQTFRGAGNGVKPGVSGLKLDDSDRGPGGARFAYFEDVNLEPKENERARDLRAPGPGEPGFVWTEQKNSQPGESAVEKPATGRNGQKRKLK